MSKKVIFYVALAAVGVFILVFSFWGERVSARVGTLNIYSGEVSLMRDNAEFAGKTGTEIMRSDTIRVHPASRASIILTSGSSIRLDAGSEIIAREILTQGDPLSLKRARFGLLRGRAWSQVEPLSNGASYEIETPTLTASVRGTSFDLSYSGAESRLMVGTGSVLAALLENPTSEVEVKEGFLLAVRDDFKFDDFSSGPREIDDRERDEWLRFNIKEGGDVVDVPVKDDKEKSPRDTLIKEPLPEKIDSVAEPPRIINIDLSTDDKPNVVPEEIKIIKKERLLLSLEMRYTQEGAFGITANIIPRAQFHVDAIYSDDTKEDVTNLVNWSVAGNAKGTVDASGLYTPGARGSDIVTARYQERETVLEIISP